MIAIMMKLHAGMMLFLTLVARCADSTTPTATSTQEVTFPLLNFLDESAENMLVSPLSITTCFSLVLPGARGDTQTQIAQSLSYPSDAGGEEVYNTFNSLRESYNSRYPVSTAPVQEHENPPPALQIANSIWADLTLQLEPAYANLIGDLLVVVDFSNATSATSLNTWVASQTNNKIETVVTPGQGLPGKLIAVNAVYFKATWSNQFEASNTGTNSFFNDPTRQAVVKAGSHFMHQIDYFSYAESSTHQILTLPYLGTSIEMVLALPRSAQTSLIGLSNDDLTAAMDSMTSTYIALALPKFEFFADYELNDVLKSMGMMVPFEDNADFSGLSSSAALKIDKVIHKTFIAVDEFGTEAAAVTAIVMRVTSANPPSRPTPLLFKADHPFLLFIRDRADGNVLFAGKVGNPNPPAGSVTPTLAADDAIWANKFGQAVSTNDNPGTNAASLHRGCYYLWLLVLLRVLVLCTRT